jgi:predicted Co/Zn/Cd cation transporter (cation efflux family)
MAIGPTMKQAIRRIAQALVAYAKEKGWSEGDYQIYYAASSKRSQIYIAFVSKYFDKNQRYENYALIKEHLARELGDMPGLLNHLALVIRSREQVEEGGIYAVGPPYREYRPLTRS